MNDVKSAITSKTIWGAIFTVAALVAGQFGIDLGGDTGGWANDLVILFGAGLSVYGRVKAVKKISL